MSTMIPPEEYAIIKIGRTISFAGRPRRNAVRIKPSRPMAFPKGLRAFARWRRRLIPWKDVFARIHVTIPAGIATETALTRTKTVRSRNERIRILTIWGRL